VNSRTPERLRGRLEPPIRRREASDGAKPPTSLECPQPSTGPDRRV
jgi:hypothetical protein